MLKFSVEMSRKQRGEAAVCSWKNWREQRGNKGFYKPTNKRTYGLQWSLCMPNRLHIKRPQRAAWLMPNGLNWIGLKGKRKDEGKGYSPRKIDTSLNPTQAQPWPLAHYFSSYYIRYAKAYKLITRFIPNQCGTQSKG